jgi:dethiobiotin synthetase
VQHQPIVVAGIGTDVGKTVASAFICEALGADYWKPVASGTDDGPVDHQIMAGLLENGEARVHQPRYIFGRSLSPHVAAELEGRSIAFDELTSIPKSSKPLVIELAGGILVPLNDTATNLDLLVHWKAPVVVVSRHYLGSINHTMLTVEVLKAKGVAIAGIIFNGEELPDTERIITKMAAVPILGRIPKLDSITGPTVRSLASAGVVKLQGWM